MAPESGAVATERRPARWQDALDLVGVAPDLPQSLSPRDSPVEVAAVSPRQPPVEVTAVSPRQPRPRRPGRAFCGGRTFLSCSGGSALFAFRSPQVPDSSQVLP